MKRILVAASLLALASPALADGLSIIHNGSNGRISSTIITAYRGGSIAQITRVEPMNEMQIERDKQWVEFCEPRVVARAPDWVGRYVYKHEGCEVGRVE